MNRLTRCRPGFGVLVGATLFLMTGAAVFAADGNVKPAATGDASAGSEGWVHCMLPGQVRRLGAFSTSVTPRRAARVSPAQCRASGGEYVEAQDHTAAVKVWLPMAGEGIAEAQTTVGELFEQKGQPAMARSWYEKAAAQGDPRALINLAGFLERAALLAGGKALSMLDASGRVADLVRAAGGGLVSGLLVQRVEALRVDFVSPAGASALPRAAAGGAVVVESSAGPAEVVARIVAPAGVKSVRVNGEIHAVDEQGLLSIPVTVGDGRTTVVVQAVDQIGTEAQAELTLIKRSAAPAAQAINVPVGAVAFPVSPGGVDVALAPVPAALAGGELVPAAPPVKTAAPEALLPGKRYALVIANQQYQRWTKLETPYADAQAVSGVLKQRFGFQVTVLQDATRQQLLAALNRLRQQVGPQDQVLVYYAGHGQMDNVTARGYWIPVDGDEKDLAQWVSVIDVTDQLSAMTARHVLVIADSCYSGTLTRSLVPAVDQALNLDQRKGPLKHLAKQRARVAMTSGGLEPVVDGGSIEHSLFARSLLDVLAQVKSPVAAQELHQSVSSRFAHLARRLKILQQPQYAPIGFAGHEAGDFVLSPI